MRGMLLSTCLTSVWLPAAAADLALHRVMLSSAGIGYFEFGAHVDGPDALGLDVPLDQVDDVLRSLAVFDAHGGVGSIELPGRDNVRQAFDDVPFNVNTLSSTPALLQSLRGAELSVSGPSAMTGRIVGTSQERVVVPPGGSSVVPAAHTRVTLLTADGLRQFILEDATAVRLTDPGLRERVAAALDAAQQQSASAQRHVTLRTTGAGPRDITVGYVVAAPLWKASYRVVLPDARVDHARVQGWAVLENQSGSDWHGVDLTLQSGNPVTFHQAIYASYYAQRPEVPVEVLGQLLPDADIRATQGVPMQMAPPAPAPMGAGMGQRAAPAMPGFAAAPMARALVPESEEHVVGSAPLPLAGPAYGETRSLQGRESAIDTSFHIAAPIDLARGHTASVPIIDRDIPAEQVDWLQPGSDRPVTALRLKNDSGASLPPGVLTLYAQDNSAGGTNFAGDARLGGLPAGESRLLAFAEDLKTTAHRWTNFVPDTLIGVKLSHGVLTESLRHRTEYGLSITAPATARRRVLVEFPKTDGAEFSMPGSDLKVVEETATARRVALDLAPNQTRVIHAYEDTPFVTATTLLPADGDFDDQVLVSVLAQDALDGAARAKLQGLADLRATEADKRAALQKLTDERDTVNQDEDRLRKNLAAVAGPGNLRDQLMDALAADEASLERLRHDIAQAQADVDQAHKALADAVGASVL